MLRFNACIAAVAMLMLSGCVSVKVGAKTEPSRLEFDGLGTAYAAVNGVRPYDGTFLRANLLSSHRNDGEVASFEVWPICGAGVGLAGARINVFPIEVGAGILFYEPKPKNYFEQAECKEKKKECEDSEAEAGCKSGCAAK